MKWGTTCATLAVSATTISIALSCYVANENRNKPAGEVEQEAIEERDPEKQTTEAEDQIELNKLNMELARTNFPLKKLEEMRSKPAELQEWADNRKKIKERIDQINNRRGWSNNHGAFGPNPSLEVIEAYFLDRRKRQVKQ